MVNVSGMATHADTATTTIPPEAVATMVTGTAARMKIVSGLTANAVTLPQCAGTMVTGTDARLKIVNGIMANAVILPVM